VVVLRRVFAEWPSILALAAASSLFLVARFARSEGLVEEREGRRLEELRRVVETGLVEDAEDRVRAFLLRDPRGAARAEAQYLAALAVVAKARHGVFPGLPALQRAASTLALAREGGFDAARADLLEREIAALLLERGFLKEGGDRLADLHRRTRDPRLALDLARTLARRAALEGGNRQALLDEAASRISEYLKDAPPEQRLAGFLAQARLSWDLGRHEEVVALVVRELADQPRGADRGLLQLERGRALARLGRPAEALAALDEAERLVTDASSRALALLFQAELFVRAGNAEAVDLCRRVMGLDSPYGPLAQLLQGVYELEFRPEEAIPTLALGLAELRRPRVVDEAGFDFAWFAAQLRKASNAEEDPGRLARFAALMPEIARLYPQRAAPVLDEARLWSRAGRPERATPRFLDASALLEGTERSEAVREAAESASKGGLHARAAELWRRWHDLAPAAHGRGLHEQARSLRAAGRPAEALTVFEEYLQRSGGRAPEGAAALLERAGILVDLGRREDALVELERLLKARDAVADPGRAEWAEALLRKGRLLLDLGRAGDARAALGEYLERYEASGGPAPAEAAELLVRAAMRDARWSEALEALGRWRAALGRLPAADRAAELGFLEGDLRFNQNDLEGAARAYGEAYRRTLGRDERLWGLVGRARCFARLGKADEARRDYLNARALLEERKEAFQSTLGGRGRDYWEAALDQLAREVR
jgi:tetratricopeptide (TPR) repeat protein